MRFSRLLAPLAFVVAGASGAHAQEGNVVIHGVVKDASTGKPVVGASVYDQETDEVAITDDNGEFTFAAGTHSGHLAVVDPSYQRFDIAGNDQATVEIKLVPLMLRGEEIVVEAERERDTAGQATLKREELMKAPGSRGDALNVVKSLPGVANTQGFGPQAGLVIRGSSPADSRIFIDGFEVPILYHLGGIQSVMPSEMIDDLVYSPGAFGVEYGKASAGTIQVTSRKGGKDLAGFAEVSFINAAVMLQGPIGTKGSFALAARRSYIDALIPLVVSDSSSLSFTALPRYYDYQGRFDYELTDHLKLTGFLFGSDDNFAIASDVDNNDDPVASGHFSNTTSFTRGIVSATYDHDGVYNKLSGTAFTQKVGFEVGSDRYLHVDPDSIAARDEARIKLADGVSLIGGGEAEYRSVYVKLKLPRPPHEGDPNTPNFTYDPLLMVDQTATGSNEAAWTALELAPTSWFKATAGARLDYFSRNSATVIEPRIQTRTKFSDQTALLAAGGLYTRPPDNQDENLQTNLRPERSWQSSVGLEQKLVPGVTLTSTAYYNARNDMIVQAAARSDVMSTDGSDTYTNEGKGTSYGAELLLQARRDKFFGWVSYTFSRSERTDHPGDPTRLFDTDQTHNLIILGSWKFGDHDKWQIGGRFQYTSGAPYTPVTGAVFESDRNTYRAEYGLVNSQRNDAQHQLDLRIDRAFQFRDWKLSGYLDVSNVYMNAPAVGYQYNTNYTERKQITGIPILPSLGLRGEF